jgi:hypothetical protein
MSFRAQIAAAVGMLAVLVGGVFLSARPAQREETAFIHPQPPPTSPALDAFLPFVWERRAPERTGEPVSGGQTGPKEVSEPPSLTDWSAEIVESFTSPAPAPAPLVLPRVADSELTLHPGGIESIEEYLVRFGERAAEITFSQSEFDRLAKADGVFLLPLELAEKSVEAKSLAETEESLRVHRDYLGRKIEFLKNIPVSGEAADLNRKMIALDRLTLELVDRTLAGGDWAGIAAYAERYKKTALGEHGSLMAKARKLGLLRTEERGFLAEVLEGLGLFEIVRAATPPIPIGGPMITRMPCGCPPFGVAVTVGPPMGGFVYLTAPFMASPAFFPYKNPAGRYILGLYTATPLTCNFPDPFTYCLAIWASPVILAGTSI